MPERLVPALRPDNTLLWLPDGIARLIGAKRGTRLSTDQMSHEEVQQWISAHTAQRKEK